MTTTTPSRHRLTGRKRLERSWHGRLRLALADLFTFTSRVKVPAWANQWRDIPLPTRSALGWITAYAVVVPGALLLSDFSGKWWGAGLVFAVAVLQLHLVLTGARMSVHAVQQLAHVLQREPVGGPVVCTAVAHCGCLHTFAWDEVAQAWNPASVVQQPTCAQVVTI
jgi:hypothetical protein